MILSISLQIFLVGIVAVFPVDQYRRYLSNRTLDGMGHVSALIGWGLQSLVFSLVIRPTGIALLVTIAYAAVSFVLDIVIPTSLDADHA